MLADARRVAYLAFLGNAFADANRFQTIGSQAATTLILAMQHYVYSVASALLSYGATYFSHGAYYFNFNRADHITMAIAVLVGLTVHWSARFFTSI